VRSTIDLAHNLGLRVVAEGVETDDARARLTALGCDAAQGTVIRAPASAAELRAWIGAGA
jgi:EAL domain-containing protein (putative c-di-GMP-specific phosphodiesterase class I)